MLMHKKCSSCTSHGTNTILWIIIKLIIAREEFQMNVMQSILMLSYSHANGGKSSNQKTICQHGLFFIKNNTSWYELICTYYSKLEKYEQSQVNWKSVGSNVTNNPCMLILNNTLWIIRQIPMLDIQWVHNVIFQKAKMHRNHIEISTKICLQSAQILRKE